MSKIGTYLKAAGGIIATTVTLLTALRENPQISQGIDQTIDKLKKATATENPKLRFEAKLRAIDTAADAVSQVFPHATEPNGWHRQAQALRMRGDLAWHSNEGSARRKAMKALNAEAAEILAGVNERLIALQAEGPAELSPSD